MGASEGTERTEALLRECDWLRRLARGLVADAQSAEDAVQETLAAALRSGPAAPSRPWLSRVLRNVVAREARGGVRRRDREVLSAEASAAPAVDEIAQRVELQARVLAAVRALDPIHRDVIVLRFLDGLPPRRCATARGEAATVTGM